MKGYVFDGPGVVPGCSWYVNGVERKQHDTITPEEFAAMPPDQKRAVEGNADSLLARHIVTVIESAGKGKEK